MDPNAKWILADLYKVGYMDPNFSSETYIQAKNRVGYMDPNEN